MVGDNSFLMLLALVVMGAVSLLAIPREKKKAEATPDEYVSLDQYADLVKLVMGGEIKKALKRLRQYGEKETDLERRRLLKRIEDELRKYV